MYRLLKEWVIGPFIATIFLTACSTEELSEQEQLFRRLKGKCAIVARDKYQLKTHGIDHPLYDKEGEITISFNCKAWLNTEEAREILVHLMHDFMEIIRSDEVSPKYLKPNLVDACNMDVSFDSEDFRYTVRGFFLISSKWGQVEYCAYDLNDPQSLNRKIFRRETFAEAERAVTEEDRLNAQIEVTPCAVH